MTSLERVSIYSVLCFISFSLLLIRIDSEPSMLPVIGFIATILGLGVELYKWRDTQSRIE